MTTPAKLLSSLTLATLFAVPALAIAQTPPPLPSVPQNLKPPVAAPTKHLATTSSALPTVKANASGGEPKVIVPTTGKTTEVVAPTTHKPTLTMDYFYITFGLFLLVAVWGWTMKSKKKHR